MKGRETQWDILYLGEKLTFLAWLKRKNNKRITGALWVWDHIMWSKKNFFYSGVNTRTRWGTSHYNIMQRMLYIKNAALNHFSWCVAIYVLKDIYKFSYGERKKMKKDTASNVSNVASFAWSSILSLLSLPSFCCLYCFVQVAIPQSFVVALILLQKSWSFGLIQLNAMYWLIKER